jgi:Mor family transcriptional regulator
MVKKPVAPTASNAVEPSPIAEVPYTDDVVEYTLRCVLALAPQLTEAIRQNVNNQVRSVFGGERAYISRRPGEGRFARNAQIRRDYKAGERIPLLQRRYGLSPARLWQIINE